MKQDASITTRTVETPYGTFDLSIYAIAEGYEEHLSLECTALSPRVIVNNKDYGRLRLSVNERLVTTYIWSDLTDSARTKLHAVLWPVAKEMLEDNAIRAAVLEEWLAATTSSIEYELSRAQEDAERRTKETYRLLNKARADLGVTKPLI